MAMTRWERFGLDWPGQWRRWLDRDDIPGWMRVEEVQEDGNLVVRAELPGIDPDKDVEVSVSDGVLHVVARREERSEKKGEKGRVRSEFRYGELRRDLALPKGVDQGAIKAGYKDGILEVRIPWPAEVEASATKIPVSRS